MTTLPESRSAREHIHRRLTMVQAAVLGGVALLGWISILTGFGGRTVPVVLVVIACLVIAARVVLLRVPKVARYLAVEPDEREDHVRHLADSAALEAMRLALVFGLLIAVLRDTNPWPYILILAITEFARLAGAAYYNRRI